MKGAVLAALLSVALLSVAPLAAGAQSPVRDTSWQRPVGPRGPCAPALDLHRSRMRSLSQHAGWGMFAGGVAGTIYGLVQAKGPLRGLVIIWDGFVGGTSGLIAGSGVYAVRRLRGYSPPLETSCGIAPREPENPAGLASPHVTSP